MSRTVFRFFMPASLLLVIALIPAGSSGVPGANFLSVRDAFEITIEGKGPEKLSPPVKLQNVEVPDLPIDFNGDGLGDMGVGLRSYDIGAAIDAGAVSIQYGRTNGKLTANRNQFLTIVDGQMVAQSGDGFGTSVAAGNFNGDRFTDIAVGMSGADHPEFGNNVGAIAIYKGSRSGLIHDRIIYGNVPNSFLGSSVVFLDSDGDGMDEIAAGAVGETVNNKPNAGAVYWFNPSGLQGKITLASPGVDLAPARDTFFGQTLHAADVNGDRRDDLGVGGPINRGVRGDVWFFFAGANGLRTNNSQRVSVRDGKAGDAFGFSLNAIHYSGFANPLVGLPGRNIIFQLQGSSSGISKTGGLALTSSDAKPGDRWSYSIASLEPSQRQLNLGVTYFAVGAPDTDVQSGSDFVVKAGAVDIISRNRDGSYLADRVNIVMPGMNEFHGQALSFSRSRNDSFNIVEGAPGATIGGFQSAGEVNVWRSPGSTPFLNGGSFHLGRLKGDPQTDALFGGVLIKPRHSYRF